MKAYNTSRRLVYLKPRNCIHPIKNKTYAASFILARISLRIPLSYNLIQMSRTAVSGFRFTKQTFYYLLALVCGIRCHCPRLRWHCPGFRCYCPGIRCWQRIPRFRADQCSGFLGFAISSTEIARNFTLRC